MERSEINNNSVPLLHKGKIEKDSKGWSNGKKNFLAQ